MWNENLCWQDPNQATPHQTKYRNSKTREHEKGGLTFSSKKFDPFQKGQTSFRNNSNFIFMEINKLLNLFLFV